MWQTFVSCLVVSELCKVQSEIRLHSSKGNVLYCTLVNVHVCKLNCNQILHSNMVREKSKISNVEIVLHLLLI